MANAAEQNQFDPAVRLIEPGDSVVGGAGAPINLPLQALANRTLWLKNQTAGLQTATAGKAAAATAVNAGDGLTGGGNLTASRTISLAQPGQITAQSQNAVQSNGHTHAIDTATTSRAGIVQLDSGTGSQAEDRAATPKAVKAAYDKATEAVNVARAISIPTATTSRAGIVQLTDRVSNATADAGKTPTTAAVNSAINDVSDRIAQANTRIDNAVTLSSNQTITAAKTFHSDIKVTASVAQAAADRYIRLGANVTGAYAVNSKTNKVLYLKHDGNITYDDKRLLNVDDLIGIIPSGAVMYFAGRNAPTGWLKANGAAVSRTTYADLFAAIGTTYGAGDGRSTFNLPDLRAEFLRGWDDGRGIDSGRAFGSAQSDAIRNIKGSLEALYGSDRYALYTKAEGAFTTDLDDGGNETFKGSGNNYANRKKRVVFDAGRSVPTADENRPRNIALLACIKI